VRPSAALVLLALAGLVSAGCQSPGSTGAAAGDDEPSDVAKARKLVEDGQPDAALAALQSAGEHPDALYVGGLAWAKKAETAPLPTPPPPTGPIPKNWELPPAPEYKEEEIRAADLFARALAARPNHARAHLALADLLAPHAARRHDQEKEAAAKKKPGKATPAAPPPPVDSSTDRVIRSYMSAMQDGGPVAAIEGIIKFGRRIERYDAAEAGFKELIQRAKEAEVAQPLERYGDFLIQDKKDPAAAQEQYRQALIWRPDDDALRGKLADIYIELGKSYYASRQFSLADTNFKEANRWVTDRSSERARTVEDYQNRLKGIRIGR
jgi:tetratricopeptide (TPR) repeat protein